MTTALANRIASDQAMAAVRAEVRADRRMRAVRGLTLWNLDLHAFDVDPGVHGLRKAFAQLRNEGRVDMGFRAFLEAVAATGEIPGARS